MSNPIPSALALTTIADNSLITASPHRSNYSQIQAALNALATALDNGTSGQLLSAVDGSDVQWSSSITLPGSARGSFIGAASSSCTLASGAITVTSGFAQITSTDGSALSVINGKPDSNGWFLILLNKSGSNIPYASGGGSGVRVVTPGVITAGAALYLVYDAVDNAWFPFAVSTPQSRNKNVLTYGATVTPDWSQGAFQTVTVTNGTAFTIAAPLNPPSSSETGDLTLEVFNNSGGAHGTITMNAVYVANTFGTIANTKKAAIRYTWNGSVWVGFSGGSGTGGY